MNRPAFKPGLLSSPFIRALLILSASAAVVGGLGCATMIATEAPNPFADSYYRKPVLKDSVYAMARPDAALAKKMGQDGIVAFLGRKHTYLLLEGGVTIEKVAHELGGSGLTLDPDTRQLYRKGNTIWGHVTLTYKPDVASSVPQVLDKVTALGFVWQKSGDYKLNVDVKGVVASASKLKKAIPDSFDKSRDIAFYNPPGSSPPPDVTKLVTVPLALVVDVALTPVYLIGFTVLVLTF